MAKISLDLAFEIQRRIIKELKGMDSAFKEIADSGDSLIDKWQKFIGIILPIQLQVIQEFGMPGDQSGLSEYNESLMHLSCSSEPLRELNEGKWRFLLKTAFGLNEYKKIDLQEARKLIGDIVEAMISEEFLAKVDERIQRLNENVSVPEKRQELLKILLPLHMSIMSQHGFEGDTGYIQAQRALMEYYYDPFIKEKVNHAQKVVFKRAGLLD